MQTGGDIGRRDNNGIRLFLGVVFPAKIVIFQPETIPLLLNPFWVILTGNLHYYSNYSKLLMQSQFCKKLTKFPLPSKVTKSNENLA